ncbi:MAG TPA: ATP-binding protein [Acidimicrobiales bacterium]
MQFAAEFASFLAAAAATALIALRPDLLTASRRSRLVLFAGFVLLTAVAFVHGSLLVADGSAPPLLALRGAGVVLVAAGLATWGRSPWWRPVLMAAMVVTAAGVAVSVASGSSVAANALFGVGAVLEAAAISRASVPSVAARVAATAAVTLLLVILVLAVALSEVLSSTVRAEAFRRLDGRASTVANEVVRRSKDQVTAANVLRAEVQAIHAAMPADAGGDTAPLQAQLEVLAQQFFTRDRLVWITSSGSVAASAAMGVDPVPLARYLAGSAIVRRALAGQNVPYGVLAFDGQLLVVAAYPNLVSGQAGSQVVGVAVAAEPVTAADLADAVSGDPAVGLAIADRSGVLLAAGTPPPFADARAVAAQAIGPGRVPSTSVGTRESSSLLLDARPIPGASGGPAGAVVAYTTRSSVTRTRDSLFRTLFLIALGGTLLALLVSALVGGQVGAGLRALTLAAARIRRGETGVRAGVHSDDEVGVLGTAFDSMSSSIEEQAEALREAAAAEARLRNRLERVVAGMGEALIATDQGGQITELNPAAERLLGKHRDRVMGRPVDSVVKLRAEDGQDLALLLDPGESWSSPALLDTTGEPVPVAVSVAPLSGSDAETVGSVILVRDVRREREVERMKTEFLSRIGHELRTPLAGVMGYANLIAHRSLPAEQMKGFSEDILSQARRLQRVIEMLEFFASSGAGRVMLRPEAMDVRALLRDAAATRSANGARVAVSVARGTPRILADSRWLATAVDELLDNAIKFSQGPALVTVRAEKAEEGRAVDVSVADQGKGMTPDELARAFGEFAQGDTSDTREFGGLGLGLPLVQRVAEGQGGAVTCSSEPGKGTRVTIRLPAAPPNERARKPARSARG